MIIFFGYKNKLQKKWFCMNSVDFYTVSERVFSQHHVCLTKQIVDGTLTLNCSVDKLQFPIYFYTPTNTVIGKCAAPQINTLKMIRCDENVIQYRDTNTTSLTITVSSYNVSGVWTCVHGLFKENINIEVLQCPQNKGKI